MITTNTKRFFGFFVLVIALGFPGFCDASAGKEGAAFLDIPVGADPAALGGAYTALAADAYAPVYNPAGLGFLESTQISGQHLNYLESMHYEFFSAVHPLVAGKSIGASIQYLGSGDVNGTDINGTPTGSYSGHYAAYNLSYGQLFGEKLALGLTGKMINGSIADVSANAFAADLGSMYQMRQNLTLAATLTNLGNKLTFLNEGDPLPMAFHLGAAWQPTHRTSLVAETVLPKSGPMSGHVGIEWRPIQMIALRTGYRTDTTKELSPLAGFTTGMGLYVWGQEFAYAWVPMGDLGDTNYFSLVIHFGEAEQSRRNLIRYNARKPTKDEHWLGVVEGNNHYVEDMKNLMQLLDLDQTRTAQVPVRTQSPSDPNFVVPPGPVGDSLTTDPISGYLNSGRGVQ